mmetsp:Transcript_3673/g.7418  ORF Transcript_3673/g.7418 Transcript_3673/m.7418 type:complete len:211 (-) Transcript_3673:748-1380(-)
MLRFGHLGFLKTPFLGRLPFVRLFCRDPFRFLLLTLLLPPRHGECKAAGVERKEDFGGKVFDNLLGRGLDREAYEWGRWFYRGGGGRRGGDGGVASGRRCNRISRHRDHTRRRESLLCLVKFHHLPLQPLNHGLVPNRPPLLADVLPRPLNLPPVDPSACLKLHREPPLARARVSLAVKPPHNTLRTYPARVVRPHNKPNKRNDELCRYL